jgi:hypothetical protein
MLDSDGQQFKYIHKANNHFSPQLIETMMTITKTMIYDVRNQSPGFGQAQMCGGVKPVNWKNLLLSFLCLEICNLTEKWSLLLNTHPYILIFLCNKFDVLFSLCRIFVVDKDNDNKYIINENKLLK